MVVKLNYYQPIFSGNRYNTRHSAKLNPAMVVKVSSVVLPNKESRNMPEMTKKIINLSADSTRCEADHVLLKQENTVGIIGGFSAFSTLIFLEKLVSWSSSRDGKESCVPFIVCSDPILNQELSDYKDVQSVENRGAIIENLRRKRMFLEKSGAKCIVMPCHVSHMWYSEISEGCVVTFLNVGDCVAMELKEMKLKPLEAGSNVRIGVLAVDDSLITGFYQEKLQDQGFEVVLPDKPTMEHMIIPAMEALNRNDTEGARNLLRIAIQVLLVRGVNIIVLASDEFRGLLPRDDPLLKKCVDPMDALAKATIKWAQSTSNYK